MKQWIAALLGALLLCGGTGCMWNGGDMTKLKGALQTERAEFDTPCHQIVIKNLYFTDEDDCIVTVTNSDHVSVEATLPEELYKDYGFSITLVDGVLTLASEVDHSFRASEESSIVIAAPLDALEIAGCVRLSVDAEGAESFHLLFEGAGTVDVTDLDTRTAEFVIAGAGDVELSGKTNTLFCGISGAGDVDAENLVASVADLSIAGAGDITCAVEDALRVSISGAGEVEYRGSPTVEESISGVGEVSQISQTVH